MPVKQDVLRFRAAHQAEESDDRGNDATDQHPHRFVRWMAREEAREVRTERIRRADSEDGEHDAAD